MSNTLEGVTRYVRLAPGAVELTGGPKADVAPGCARIAVGMRTLQRRSASAAATPGGHGPGGSDRHSERQAKEFLFMTIVVIVSIFRATSARSRVKE